MTYRAIKKPFVGEIVGEDLTTLEGGQVRVVVH
jgi:hypothetical protein